MIGRQAALVTMAGVSGALLLLNVDAHAQTVRHVDAAATGPVYDGASWCSAFLDLQDALAVAQPGDQIRVAGGVYKPDRGTGDRSATFTLKSQVSLLGGFAGCGAPDSSVRDYAAYPSVLSGDLLGDDGPDFINYADNSYHVVTYDDPSATGALLEGFTVSSGNADGKSGLTNQGGGIHIRLGLIKCLPGGPTIRDCIVEKNFSVHHGAVNDHGLSTVMENCTVRENRSHHEGAGLQVHSGSPTVAGCTFINNTSLGSGGGVWVGSDVDPTCSGASTASFTDCLFEENRAELGGGMYMSTLARPTVTRCTFVRNVTVRDGAGIYASLSDGTVVDSVFLDNTASEGGGVYHVGGGGVYTGCAFRGNHAFIYAAAVRNLISSPVFTDCVFVDNVSDDRGGAFHNLLSNATIDRCGFFGNRASRGAAIFNVDNSNPVVRNSVFAGNVAELYGAAISSHEASRPVVANATFYGNTAAFSPALYNDPTSMTLLSSAVIWQHSPGAMAGVLATYSNIQGGFAGEGNIDVLPLFEDADGPDGMLGTEDDDLRLRPLSPGINGGNPAFSPLPDEEDLGGGPRLIGCRVDMGAYESNTPQALGDFNGDHAVNLADFAHFQTLIHNPVSRAAWQATYLCVFDADGNSFLDLADHAMLPWGFADCGSPCDDGDVCNGLERCLGGACRSGAPLNCDDGDVCTDDACEKGACVHANNAASCDDQSACTAGDVCTEGRCAGVAVVCDDDQPCTDDSCDPAVGCAFVNDNENSCDDGDPCNGEEACSGGHCLPGSPLICGDDNPCTDDSCDPVKGCVFAGNDQGPCDDGNACTMGDVCLDGFCQGGDLVDCTGQGAPCNLAACDPGGIEGNCDGRIPLGPGELCDSDSTRCTIEQCDALGECLLVKTVDCPGPLGACAGGQVCEPGTGECVDVDAPPQGAPCEADGDLCTLDECDGTGQCTFAVNVSCPERLGECDGGQACDPETGLCADLVDPPGGTPCEADGDLCTDDECNGVGACTFARRVVCTPPFSECDGGWECNASTGACEEAPDLPAGAPCNEDGDACTVYQCDGAGNCLLAERAPCPGPTGDCDGGKACDPQTGDCADLEDPAFGTPCETDDDLCTIDQCDGLGSCAVADRVMCTPAAGECGAGQHCDPATGDCVDDPAQPEGVACDEDDDLCTIDQCDGQGACVFHSPVECPGPVSDCDGGQSCDPATGKCVGNPDPAGTPCDADGNLCTVDLCNGKGACVFVSPVPCESPTNACDGGQYCEPSSGACVDNPDSLPLTPCIVDDDPCTQDECNGLGSCIVGPRCDPCDPEKGCLPSP